ncbi:hypothetical protein ACPWSR_02385 [Alloiococcus sp. CFN-8]|uniref:hypothetical protein n=1 Tax=Alloiococcus sp. CFN-8 TaxID=3416081 RepID=UPI003CE99036
MKRYDKSYISMAIELYEKGNSAQVISSILGPNEATIRKWLKDNGIFIRDGGYYNRIYSQEIIDKIISLYSQGIYSTEIDIMLKLPKGISAYLLKNNNIKLNHRGPKSMIKNETFFNKIDTEEKAYFLGWLMADGNISIINNQYSIKIHIALRDRELIDKFIEAIGSKNKTKIKDGTHPSYYISLTSRHMCEALINLGVMPNKTGKEKFPIAIPDNLKRHFIRGVFDGDGITNITRARCGFVGGRELLEDIKNYIGVSHIRLYKSKTKTPNGNNIFYFLGGKKFSRMLYDYMYVDATIYLKRKRNRMDIICSKDGTPYAMKVARTV